MLFYVRIMVLKKKNPKTPPHQTKPKPKSKYFVLHVSSCCVTLWHDSVLLSFLVHTEYIHSAMLPAGKYCWDWDIVSKNSQLCRVYVIYVLYAILLSHWTTRFWKKQIARALAFYHVLLNTAIMYFTSLHLNGSIWTNIHPLKASAAWEHCHGLWYIIFCKDIPCNEMFQLPEIYRTNIVNMTRDVVSIFQNPCISLLGNHAI